MRLDWLVLAWSLVTVLGFAICLAGYRVFRFLLGVGGGLAGLWLGLVAAEQFGLRGAAVLGLSVGCGILLAYAATVIYQVGVVAGGGMMTNSVVLMFAALIGKPVPDLWLLGLFACGGLLTLIWQRRLIIGLTAVAGALLTVMGAMSLLSASPSPLVADVDWLRLQVANLPLAQLALVAVAAVVGALVQSRWTAGSGSIVALSRADASPDR